MHQDMAVAGDRVTGVAEARDMDAAGVLFTARDVVGGRIAPNPFVLIQSLFKMLWTGIFLQDFP